MLLDDVQQQQIAIPSQQLDGFLDQPTQPQPVRQINEAVEELVMWLIQETVCPEILPYQNELIDGSDKYGNYTPGIKELLQAQKEGVSKMKNEIEHANKQRDIQYLMLHVIELERIEFIYQEYLRIRLKKLSQFQFYYHNSRIESNLSQPEREFLNKLVHAKHALFTTLALQKYPRKLQTCGVDLRGGSEQENSDKITVAQPDLNKCVFALVKSKRVFHIGAMYAHRPIGEGDIIMVSYSEIRKLIGTQIIQLL